MSITSTAEFYQLPVVGTSTDLVPFFASEGVFPELGFSNVPNPNSLSNFRTQTKVQIKIVKYTYYRKGSLNEREIWSLASIWFEGDPIAVIRNVPANDNDGTYYPNRFITDAPKFNLMIKYLFSLVQKEETGFTNTADRYFAENYAGQVQDWPLILEGSSFNLEDFLAGVNELIKG